MVEVCWGWVGVEGSAGFLEECYEVFAGLLEATELFEAAHSCSSVGGGIGCFGSVCWFCVVGVVGS